MTKTSGPPISRRDASSASAPRNPSAGPREDGPREAGRREDGPREAEPREPVDRWDDAEQIAAGLRQPVPLFGFDIEPTG